MGDEWLQNLKKGDKVYVSRGYGLTGDIAIVSRTTKTQILIKYHDTDSYEYRYRKKNGLMVGSTAWRRSVIHELTQERADAIKLSKLKTRAVYLRDNLSIPQTEEELNKLIKALTPFVEKKP